MHKAASKGFLFQGRQLYHEENESCLSCRQHAYWSSSSSLPNIIILSQTVCVIACTRFQLQGRQSHNKQSESCLSCMGHAYWSSSSFLPNITKLCLRVSKLWRTQGWVYSFCFRRDNQIANKVRVVSLALDMPTGPPLQPTKYYQIISNSMGVMAYTRFQLQGR